MYGTEFENVGMNKKTSNKNILFLSIGLALGIFLMFIIPKFSSLSLPKLKTEKKQPETTSPKITEEFEYGIRVDTLNIIRNKILPNQFVSEILEQYNVTNQTVHNLAMQSKEVFDFRNFRAGNNYSILASKNTDSIDAQYLVYEKDRIESVIYNLKNIKDIQIHKKPTTKVENRVAGTIHGSLWNTLEAQGANPELAVFLSQVYQWTIDFTRINAGDQFKAVFNEIHVDNEFYKTDSIKACYFNHGGKDYYAFYFDQGNEKQAGFYDVNGESLKRAFLRAPVKYSRISSRYTGRRFHPVQKRFKAHLGTDYAAPRGTPIYATADGTVTKATYNRGNGRYVKIRHNKTYSTQYLHMSKIAKGMKPGVRVSQGQVIGYVGSTGLATGPHVCYRFWKNGRQVDHLKLDLPAGDPIPENKMEEFEEVKALLLEKLKETKEIRPKEDIDNLEEENKSLVNEEV